MAEPPVPPRFLALANHMHWAGRAWLWGAEVPAASIEETLRLAEALGGCINLDCDAATYERLASESPQVLERLRDAVASGRVEVVGVTYGQPYGLFLGGESNVRQRALGARAIRRLLNVWPRASWQEEFDFFPQLPQILLGCGVRCTALAYAWTRHTPSLPLEDAPLVRWVGLDGSALPTLPNSQEVLSPWSDATVQVLDARADAPSWSSPWIALWLELLPGPDWTCRLERFLPALRRLCDDAVGRARAVGLSALVEALSESPTPERAYAASEAFHGVSLGKNADFVPRYARSVEDQLLAAESLSALCGLFGRPYPSWNVYPHWELEHAWKELCVAQHHDVHTSEGLVGAVGERYFEKSLGIAGEVFARSLEHLAARVDAPEGTTLVFNPLGWKRDIALSGEGGGIVRDVPAFGYRVIDPYEVEDSRLGSVDMRSDDALLTFERGDFRVEIDRARGVVTQVYSRDFPRGLLRDGQVLGEPTMITEGREEGFDAVSYAGGGTEDDWAEFSFLREGRNGNRLRVVYGIAPLHQALWVRVSSERLARPDPGTRAALSMDLAAAVRPLSVSSDHPFGISSVGIGARGVRQFPRTAGSEGELASEELEGVFSSSSLVDLCQSDENGRGLLIVHDGSQAWVRSEGGVRCVLNAYDAWDDEYFDDAFEIELALLPHGRITHAQRARLSMELNQGSPRFNDHLAVRGGGDLPPEFGALAVDGSGVLPMAFLRVRRADADDLPDHFCARFEVADPFVLRLVEYDGKAADVLIRVPGAIARAARTNLLGEVLEELTPSTARAASGPKEVPWSAVRLSLRAHEVATLMFDLELGRQSEPQPHGRRSGGPKGAPP